MKPFNFGSRISLTSICICKHTSIGHELNSLRSRISDLTTSHFHSHLQAYINWTLVEFNLWYKFGSINRTLIVLPCTLGKWVATHTKSYWTIFADASFSWDQVPWCPNGGSADGGWGPDWGPNGAQTEVPRRKKNAKKSPKKIGRAGHGGIRTQSENPKFIYHRHHIDTHAHTERVTALKC
jgi:hypothetical protein